MKNSKNKLHELIQQCRELRDNSSFRLQKRAAFIEGDNLVSDLLLQYKASYLFVQEGASLPKNLQASEVYTVPRYVIEKMSSVKTPQTLCAIVPIPEQRSLKDKKRVLAFDSVQDPGNIGTMIRTAYALGWDGLFFIGNCCDPWNDKALRAAKGATFFMPMEKGSRDDFKTFIHKETLHLFAADMKGAPLNICSIPSKIALLVGNEGGGVDPFLKESAEALSIPMKEGIESLNVGQAAAIMMYALRPQHG